MWVGLFRLFRKCFDQVIVLKAVILVVYTISEMQDKFQCKHCSMLCAKPFKSLLKQSKDFDATKLHTFNRLRSNAESQCLFVLCNHKCLIWWVMIKMTRSYSCKRCLLAITSLFKYGWLFLFTVSYWAILKLENPNEDWHDAACAVVKWMKNVRFHFHWITWNSKHAFPEVCNLPLVTWNNLESSVVKEQTTTKDYWSITSSLAYHRLHATVFLPLTPSVTLRSLQLLLPCQASLTYTKWLQYTFTDHSIDVRWHASLSFLVF